MAAIPNSGCWAPPLPHDECSDTHGPAGDSFRPIEITGSAIGGWFGPEGDKEHLSASKMWDIWLSSVGVGGGWILNLPPTVDGQIPGRWAAPAIAFGNALRVSFSKPVASNLLKENTTVECGVNAAPLIIPIPAAVVGAWNAIRSAEDVFHHGQLVSDYLIEAQPKQHDGDDSTEHEIHGRGGGGGGGGTGGGGGEEKWLNVTSRGNTVGVGTIDQVGHPSRSAGLHATQLRWRCLSARGGATAVSLSLVELYFATPPE